MRISDWSSDVCSSDLKLPATTLLLALMSDATVAYLQECHRTGEQPQRDRIAGMGAAENLSNFYGTVTYVREGEGWRTPFDAPRLRGTKLLRDLLDHATAEWAAKAGDQIPPRRSRNRLEAGPK